MSIQITIMAQSVNELCGYLGVLANGVPGAIPAENVTLVLDPHRTPGAVLHGLYPADQAVDTLEPGEEIAAASSSPETSETGGTSETTEAPRRRGRPRKGTPQAQAASKPDGAAPKPNGAAPGEAEAASPAAPAPGETDFGTDAKDTDPVDPFDAPDAEPGTAPPRDPAVDHGLALELLRTLYDKPGLAVRVSDLLVSYGVAKFSAIPKAKGSELLAQARAIQAQAA